MKKILVMLPLLGSFCLSAQLSVDNVNTNYTIDFQTTVDGVNNGVYNGSGFSSIPSDGQLDSDGFIIQGCSDGDMIFGEEKVSSDFTRGVSEGGVTTGGIYAFLVEVDNYALGLQPTTADLSSGEVILKFYNNTGGAISDILLHYDIWCFNDQDRASSFNLFYSLDGIDYTPVTDLDFISEVEKQESATWKKVTRAITISLQVSANENVFLKWITDDAGGSSSRDELAIDNIIIEARSAGSNTAVTKCNTKTIAVTPNPFDNQVIIQSKSKLKQIELFDISGKLILRKNNLYNDKTVVLTSDLKVGFYLVKALDVNGNVITEKVYKTKL